MIVNLTPHDIVLMKEDREVIETFPASGEVLRLSTIDLGTNIVPGVGAVEYVEFGHLNGAPPRKAGTWYVVSLPCALAWPREDFLVPYMEVRDEKGRVIGCRFLARPV
jgi:hypothetical protein